MCVYLSQIKTLVKGSTLLGKKTKKHQKTKVSQSKLLESVACTVSSVYSATLHPLCRVCESVGQVRQQVLVVLPAGSLACKDTRLALLSVAAGWSGTLS